MIKIKVDGSVVSVQETEALYCGSQGVYTCSFIFDKSWDRFRKSAVFRVNEKVITTVIGDDRCCTLPWELLTRGNIGLEIEVGVYGVSADAEILTSVWDSIGVVREGSELGGDAREPSDGVYEQVMASVQRVDEKITSYNAEVQTQVQRAESAATVATDRARDAVANAAFAKRDAEVADSAKDAVLAAVNNLPAGSTLVINDLTTGGTAAALSAEMGKVLAQRPNPDLLHNWYFENSVNQRGQTEYSGAGYAIDRWKFTGASSVLKVVDGGITFTPTATSNGIRQDMEYPEEFAGKTVTVSFLLGDANGVKARAGYGDGSNHFGEWGESGIITATGTVAKDATALTAFIQFDAAAESPVIIAAKLELGSTQTLAHQDASGNWILNEIPDFGEELRKCQRYFRRIGNSIAGIMPLGVSLPSSSVTLTTQFNLGQQMRALPAVTPSADTALVYTADAFGNAIEPTKIARSGVIDNSIVEVALTGTYTVGTPYTVGMAANAYIDFSADL